MPKSRSKRQRRQPPPKPKPKQSPPWVGALFFVLMGAGIASILYNYISGGGQAWLLWAGIGLIAMSFVVSTQWH
jgi:TM2 domain-containing membrane protein YozV